MNVDYAKDLKVTPLKKYRHVPEIKDYKGLARDKIALVFATGDIMMGEGDDETVGADRVSRAIRKARRDSSIKAIVLRVNSPGGSVLASDIIWREVKLAQQVKPVIASMGDLAASGGYYIVAPVDTILASPVTLTGSIGVFGVLLNAKEFMNDKLGITADIVKTNEHADFPNFFRPLSPTERTYLKYSIEQSYEDFINYVAEGRGMKVEEVKDIAQGRVWSGVNAKDIQLIDMYGGMQAAIELAAEKTGLDRYRVVEYPKQEDPFEAILKEFTSQARGSFLKNGLGPYYDHYQQVKNLLRMENVQARMPYSIVVE
jgi:protease-4